MSAILRKFQEAGVLKVVEGAIVEAVAKSLDEDKKKGGSEMALTLAEQRRRGEICINILEELCMHRAWGVKRACDYLYKYLRCELDEIAWSPDSRQIWVPGEPLSGA